MRFCAHYKRSCWFDDVSGYRGITVIPQYSLTPHQTNRQTLVWKKFYQTEVIYSFEFNANRLISVSLRNQITSESEFRSRVAFLIGCLLLQLRYPAVSTQWTRLEIIWNNRHNFFDLLFDNDLLLLTVLNHIESKKKEKGNLNRSIAINGSKMRTDSCK